MSPRRGLTPRQTDWLTVSRKVTLTLSLCWKRVTSVEAGLNTSTVTLRVGGGDEKGRLRSVTVKYGRESQGTRTWERIPWQGPAAYTKERPILPSERMPHRKQDRNCQTKINIWSWAPDGARHQDLLTDWPSVTMWLWLWLLEAVFVMRSMPRLYNKVQLSLQGSWDGS
jgi:hypothetical protein